MEKIASKEPAPASGSACAAVVASAAALVEKSARLSQKQWVGAAGALASAHALRLEGFGLIEEDAQAYLAFVDAVRSQHDVAAAHALTVDVPLRMIRAAAEVAELAVQLANHGNPNLPPHPAVGPTLPPAPPDSAP